MREKITDDLYLATVAIDTLCSDQTCFEIGAREMLDRITAAIDTAPPETRDSVTIEVELRTEWDEPLAEVIITRRETAAEAREREACEAERLAALRAGYEARQRADYERLKAKFG